MKELNDYSGEINRCSKCGLCQSVCPVYKVTGNDCAVSRGKFIMLGGVLKGDIKLNKNVNKYLDLCLKCNKCSDFCPSGIDVCEIFNCAKYEYAKKSIMARIPFLLQSEIFFNGIIKIISTINRVLRIRKTYKISNTKTKILYFKGCVNEIYPKTENAVKKILSKLEVNLEEKNFDCCGLPFLSSGNINRFMKAVKHNSELFNSDCDYIMTDCASCENTLKNYEKFTGKNGLKIINFTDFIADKINKLEFPRPVTVTFHKPCHGDSAENAEKILNNIKNVTYKRMAEFDDCCGFAGEFAIKNRKISLLLSKKKAKNIDKTGANYVVTTCPACILGLKQGLSRLKSKTTVMSLAEFLAYCY